MIPELKPSELAQAVKICVAAGRVFMVHGSPGCGKSQIVGQVADEIFAPKYPEALALSSKPYFIDLRAAQLDAVDIRGVPAVVKGKTIWAIPEFLPTDDRGGILFLDEINRGPEMVQNALFSLCDKGEVGAYKLPKNWVVGAAVNDQDAGARKMSAALSARFEHFDVKTDLEDVCQIAIKRGWHPMVIAFLRRFPHLLHAFDAKARVSPNPRSWEFVSQILQQDPPLKLMLALVGGAVGEGTAIEVASFFRLYQSLPDIDGIIMDPLKAVVPTEPSVIYAVSAALARRMSDKNVGRIVQYLDRLPVEYNVASVVAGARLTPGIRTTEAFTAWVIKHAAMTVA